VLDIKLCCKCKLIVLQHEKKHKEVKVKFEIYSGSESYRQRFFCCDMTLAQASRTVAIALLLHSKQICSNDNEWNMLWKLRGRIYSLARESCRNRCRCFAQPIPQQSEFIVDGRCRQIKKVSSMADFLIMSTCGLRTRTAFRYISEFADSIPAAAVLLMIARSGTVAADSGFLSCYQLSDEKAVS